MGKIKDTIDWFEEKVEKVKKVKDTYGTGLEAMNPNNIADALEE